MVDSKWAQFSRIPSVETKRSEIMTVADILAPRKSIYGYIPSQVLDAAKPIQVTSGTDRRKKMMFILHRFMCMVLGDLKSSCSAGLDTFTTNNMKLNCFTIFGSYCCDNLERKNIRGN